MSYTFLVGFLCGGITGLFLGLLCAGLFYRLGIRDCLLGLPHPEALVRDVVSVLRKGQQTSDDGYEVSDSDRFGMTN